MVPLLEYVSVLSLHPSCKNPKPETFNTEAYNHKPFEIQKGFYIAYVQVQISAREESADT